MLVSSFNLFRNHSIMSLISFAKNGSNQRSIVSVYGPEVFGTVLQTRGSRNNVADTKQPEKVTPKLGGRKSTAGHGTIGTVLPTSGRRTKASERNKII
jgi:hypothetical protein